MSTKDDLSALSARIGALEATVKTFQLWVGILAVFGLTLGGVLAWVRTTAVEAASAARDAKRDAKAATDELQTKGQAILDSYKPAFETWVHDVEAPLVPSGIVIGFRGQGDIPVGWTECGGMQGTVLLGTEAAAHLGLGSDRGERFVRVDQLERLINSPNGVSNITVSLFRVRWICR